MIDGICFCCFFKKIFIYCFLLLLFNSSMIIIIQVCIVDCFCYFMRNIVNILVNLTFPISGCV